MAFATDWTLFVAHAGDSRAYLFSNGDLRQLTNDHTVVAELVRRGDLSPDAVAGHRFRHVVTNVLGGSQPGARVELHKLDLEPGDVLLLCTDGLTEMVKDDRIAAVLADGRRPQLDVRTPGGRGQREWRQGQHHRCGWDLHGTQARQRLKAVRSAVALFKARVE